MTDVIDIVNNNVFLHSFNNSYHVDSIINSQKVNISENERELNLINYSIERGYLCFVALNKILNNYQITGYLSFKFIDVGFAMRITFLYANNDKIFNNILQRFITHAKLKGIDYIEIETTMKYYKKLLEFNFSKVSIAFDKNTGDFRGVNMKLFLN